MVSHKKLKNVMKGAIHPKLNRVRAVSYFTLATPLVEQINQWEKGIKKS